MSRPINYGPIHQGASLDSVTEFVRGCRSELHLVATPSDKLRYGIRGRTLMNRSIRWLARKVNECNHF